MSIQAEVLPNYACAEDVVQAFYDITHNIKSTNNRYHFTEMATNLKKILRILGYKSALYTEIADRLFFSDHYSQTVCGCIDSAKLKQDLNSDEWAGLKDQLAVSIDEMVQSDLKTIRTDNFKRAAEKAHYTFKRVDGRIIVIDDYCHHEIESYEDFYEHVLETIPHYHQFIADLNEYYKKQANLQKLKDAENED